MKTLPSTRGRHVSSDDLLNLPLSNWPYDEQVSCLSWLPPTLSAMIQPMAKIKVVQMHEASILVDRSGDHVSNRQG